MNQNLEPHRQALRLKAVMERVGLRRSWIYREARAGRFPQPRKIGGATVWDSSQIDAFLADHLSEAK